MIVEGTDTKPYYNNMNKQYKTPGKLVYSNTLMITLLSWPWYTFLYSNSAGSTAKPTCLLPMQLV
jgi:hypothetical protein